jgi:hypothetical protein
MNQNIKYKNKLRKKEIEIKNNNEKKEKAIK